MGSVQLSLSLNIVAGSSGAPGHSLYNLVLDGVSRELCNDKAAPKISSTHFDGHAPPRRGVILRLAYTLLALSSHVCVCEKLTLPCWMPCHLQFLAGPSLLLATRVSTLKLR